MNQPSLSSEDIEILKHTRRTGRYVTGDADAMRLALIGMLRDHGPQALAGGDHYYTLTTLGNDALNKARIPNPRNR